MVGEGVGFAQVGDGRGVKVGIAAGRRGEGENVIGGVPAGRVISVTGVSQPSITRMSFLWFWG